MPCLVNYLPEHVNMSQVEVAGFEAFLVMRLIGNWLANGGTHLANDGL